METFDFNLNNFFSFRSTNF